jgi:phospholipase C
MSPRIIARAGLLPALGALVAGVPSAAVAEGRPIEKINHVVVIYQENWSFDSLYGKFPGANGFAKADPTQIKLDGSKYSVNPQAVENEGATPQPDLRIPASLPVAPFDLTTYIKANELTGDLVHRYYQEQVQMDGGKNDKFLAASDNPGLVMSYYDASDMAEGQLARQYVMADNFFHSAFGGSFLNHQWLVCACTPRWDIAAKPVPENKRTVLDANNLPVEGKDGFITVAPDNYVINTAYTVNTPHPRPKAAAPDNTPLLVPNLTDPTIGDRLTEKGVSWAWYSGGWNQALVGNADPNFQYHHQPFAFYAKYADGTAAKTEHLKDEQLFFSALAQDQLPAVSFIKPIGNDNEHPGYTNLVQGQQHVAGIVRAIRNSSAWRDTAIVITYDENGGRWDHVAAPKGDRWGPGVRVPTIIISPYARRAFVDHTQYETVSILKFIESRWGLAPLGSRDAAAADLTNAFDFGAPANASANRPRPGPAPFLAAVGLLLLAAIMVAWGLRSSRARG